MTELQRTLASMEGLVRDAYKERAELHMRMRYVKNNSRWRTCIIEFSGSTCRIIGVLGLSKDQSAARHSVPICQGPLVV